MSPMGYGGMNVGGMNVGGMNYMMPQMGMYGGMPVGGVLPAKGTPAYDAMRAKAQRTRDLKKDIIDSRIQELIQEAAAQNIRLPKAKARIEAVNEYNLANYEMKRGEPKPRVSRKGMPRGPQSQLSQMFSPFQKRLNVSAMKKKSSQFIGLDDATLPQKLQQLDASLKQLGLGIMNMETGGAWYDDLWSGIKSGAKVAEHILPFVL